jgi:hypothetical protein
MASALIGTVIWALIALFLAGPYLAIPVVIVRLFVALSCAREKEHRPSPSRWQGVGEIMPQVRGVDQSRSEGMPVLRE